LLTMPADTPHWWGVLAEDSEWITPPVGWGTWSGNYVYKKAYPYGEQADLYTFGEPDYAAQPITAITAHYLVGRDLYPYGQCRIIGKTNGVTFYGDYAYPNDPHLWYEQTWTVNPITNAAWTRDELNAIELGIGMDKVGSYGQIMCDQIYITVHYA